MCPISSSHTSSLEQAGLSESHAYTKHKDRTPEDTVDMIRSILESAEIDTMVEWSPNEYEGAYSNRVSVPGVLLGTNGKGTTREYALASGYAEFMERLQNNLLTPLNRIKYASYESCGFYDQPDERLMPAAQIVERHQDGLGAIFSALDYHDDKSRREALEKLSYARYGRNDGMLPEVPYVDVAAGEIVWVPSALIRQAYSSNGMASGNTMEECFVQGLSEIFERHVNHCVLQGEITPPPIPSEHLAQWNVSDIIARIEESGRYRVHVYDGSMGRGYPVVMSMIVDRVDATCGIKFGSHPSLPIAVERTLTEALQGRNIEKLTHINKLSNDDAAIQDLGNIRSIMRNGSGLYPVGAFHGQPSWEFVSWGATESASNEEMFKGMLEILRREGRRLIVRDVSHLGFPSCQIIVPGLSELLEGDADAVEAEFQLRKKENALDRFPHLTPDEEQLLLSMEPPFSAPKARILDMFERPFTSAKMSCWRLYGFLHLSHGEFEAARPHFEKFTEELDEVAALYWRALATYCDWRAKGKGHEDALQLVGLFYPPAFRRRVERDTQDFEHMMEAQFPQMNCDDCDHCDMGAQGACCGAASKEVYAKIMAALAKSTVRQEPLIKRLTALGAGLSEQ